MRNLALIAVLALGMKCTPPPSPPSPPVHPDACLSVDCACVHMCTLGCSEGCLPTCPSTLTRIDRDRVVPIDIVCLATASTLVDLEACAVLECTRAARE